LAGKEKPGIDWEAVRQRLAKTGERLAERSRPSRDHIEEVLRRRAEAFARREKAEPEGEFLEALEFTLASERYAFTTELIREVAPLHELTPVPCTPAFVLGIVNIRSEILSVIDLRRFFDLPWKGITDLSKLIVLKSQEMQFGVLADSILGVTRIWADGLRKLPTLTGVREEYLKGVSAQGTVVLDAGRLLADRSIIVYEKAE